MEERLELINLIDDMFRQACWTDKGYNHMYMSVYEEAQRLLLKEKMIDISSCVYKE